MNREALIALKEKVEAGTFPVDVSARILGLSEVAEGSGLPVIKEMYRSFSGSLDAAKALHEAVLPDEGWHVEWVAKYPNLAFKPAAWCATVGWGTRYAAYSENPARAWLLALLSALIAQEEGADGQG